MTRIHPEEVFEAVGRLAGTVSSPPPNAGS